MRRLFRLMLLSCGVGCTLQPVVDTTITSPAPTVTQPVAHEPAALPPKPHQPTTVASTELRRCLGPSFSWGRCEAGDWARTKAFAGPDAYQRWTAARRCIGDGSFTPLLVQVYSDSEVDQPSWSRGCDPLAEDPEALEQAKKAPPVSSRIRNAIYRLEPSDVEHLLDGDEVDPLAFDARNLHLPGGVADSERFTSVVLEILPVQPDALLSCMAMNRNGDEALLRPFLAHWNQRWTPRPYAVIGGGFILYVDDPPAEPDQILEVARELVLVNEEAGIWEPEVFVSTASSHFWDFWWD